MKFQEGQKVWYWKQPGEIAWGNIQKSREENNGTWYMISGDHSFRAEGDIVASEDELKTIYSQAGSRMFWCLQEAKRILKQTFSTDVWEYNDYQVQLAIELFKFGSK